MTSKYWHLDVCFAIFFDNYHEMILTLFIISNFFSKLDRKMIFIFLWLALLLQRSRSQCPYWPLCIEYLILIFYFDFRSRTLSSLNLKLKRKKLKMRRKRKKVCVYSSIAVLLHSVDLLYPTFPLWQKKQYNQQWDKFFLKYF